MASKQRRGEIDLSKLKARPVTDYFELADVETLLSRCHPLGANKAIGRRLTYSVSYGGEWIAVLVFDGAVKRNRLREAAIGWSAGQRDARLLHVANNSRFLILPRYQCCKNVASKVLSLVTDRLAADWMKRYQVPLLAVETYVDPEHNNNTGTCYTAAGWENLGYSTGFQAQGRERTHGKLYFLKPLHKDSFAALAADIPHALLTGVKPASGESNNNYVLDASKFDMQALQQDLKGIDDPRSKMGQRYKFVPLLSHCIAAVISGYTQYRQIADWIARLPLEDRVRFGLPSDRVPCEVTIGNLLKEIDPTQLQTVLQAWVLKTYKRDVDFSTVVLDGKAQRATSYDPAKQKGFLNVFANELGIVIEHVPTAKGAGEVGVAQEVIKGGADLTGKIILADAIHTDRRTIRETEKKTAPMSSLLRVIRSS